MFLTQGPDGVLLTEDGRRFAGRLLGDLTGSGEAVFTTNLTGYQEVLTDPSFAGQIVVMTAPMIGTYGVCADDEQSSRPWVAGFVVRELSPAAGAWRSSGSLADYLLEHRIPTLAEVDTRAVTHHIRSAGAMRAVIGRADEPERRLRERLAAEPPMAGRDLASVVSTAEPYELRPEGEARGSVVCVDYGVKRRSLELILEAGYAVRVVPSSTKAADILAMGPDGVFLSNGPGDPEAVAGATPLIRDLSAAAVPLLGICLGHQLIGRAFGGRTRKLPYGHRGGNHPVLRVDTGSVEITSQNHGFTLVGADRAVEGAPDLRVTHRNLNDGTVEGLAHRTRPVFGVQYHPESAPGPHDSRYVFERFVDAMGATRATTTG
ncbi:MAG: glutamine-hydrolyzing carbamoyl-phosphate synthase small subunit [Gemmatimonadota bacterium]